MTTFINFLKKKTLIIYSGDMYTGISEQYCSLHQNKILSYVRKDQSKNKQGQETGTKLQM